MAKMTFGNKIQNSSHVMLISHNVECLLGRGRKPTRNAQQGKENEMCSYMPQSTTAAAVQMGGSMDCAWNWPPSLSDQHHHQP